MSVQDVMDLLSLQDVVFTGGVVAIVVVTLIQSLSKRFKPWSWLAAQFGKAINAEMLTRLDDVDERLVSLEKTDKLGRAESARRRIITFADDVRRRVKHSLEHFNSIQDDISFYEHYCEDNPEFQNEKAGASINVIRKEYLRCIEEDDFL